MSEFVFILLSGLLPLIIIIVALVLLKRIADGVDRLEGTLDRRLLRIQQALNPGDAEAEGRWPPEE
jgi:hypothetical protein